MTRYITVGLGQGRDSGFKYNIYVKIYISEFYGLMTVGRKGGNYGQGKFHGHPPLYEALLSNYNNISIRVCGSLIYVGIIEAIIKEKRHFRPPLDPHFQPKCCI